MERRSERTGLHMHILQISDFYRPVIGGLERHVETLSRELVSLGHSVTVVTLQSGDQPDEETIDGVQVIRIRGWTQSLMPFYADPSRPFHPTVPDPGIIASLRRVVHRELPTVVHSHSWMQYSYFPLHRADRGPAHVVTLHDYGLACARKSLQRTSRSLARQANYMSSRPSALPLEQSCSGPQLAKCLTCAPDQYGALKGTAITTGLRASRALHGRADRYIAISMAVADGLRQVIPVHCQVDLVPTMVPNDFGALTQSTPRPAFLPPEDGYLMFVGALGRHKGVDVLLQARRLMRNRPPLVLLGTSNANTPLIDDPDVIVAHNIPSAQVMASWIRASVAVVPSVWQEPLGQVAIEAMLAGRPVVASDVGGLRDVVQHNSTGLLVPPSDPGSLAAALDSLLDNPELRKRMGEAGRTRAHQYTAAVVVPRIVEIFEDVLSHRSIESERKPHLAIGNRLHQRELAFRGRP
jgi:glycosyltransferase involved in cell wall biosynthesis